MNWLEVTSGNLLGLGPTAEPEVVELTVALPAALAAALVREADRRGLTSGQMVRRLVSDFVAAADLPRVEEAPAS